MKRHSGVYVFCVLKEMDQEKVDPLKLDQWDFYVLTTSIIDSVIPNQKTIALSSLLRLDPIVTDFDGLSNAIKNFD